MENKRVPRRRGTKVLLHEKNRARETIEAIVDGIVREYHDVVGRLTG